MTPQTLASDQFEFKAAGDASAAGPGLAPIGMARRHKALGLAVASRAAFRQGIVVFFLY
jgi:hypothetical protein